MTSIFYDTPVQAATGLNWSDSYVGQFLNFPHHYGFGVATALVMFPSKAFSEIFDNIWGGLQPFFYQRFFLPTVVFDARIGGVFGIPIDFGIKLGIFPPIPVFVLLTYDNYQFGLDIRNRIWRGQYSLTELSIGFGYVLIGGQLNGSIENFMINELLDSADFKMKSKFGWDATIYNLKIQINQPLFRSIMTLFFNTDIGYIKMNYYWSMTGPSVNLVGVSGDPGQDWMYGGNLEVPGGVVSSIITMGSEISLNWERTGLAIAFQAGLGFEFKNGPRLDFSVITSPYNMEISPNLSLRFQK
jgi:hypothetical protein